MSGFNLVQNPDGADFQAQAVLAYVRFLIGDGIEESWDPKWKRYQAEIKVSRYDNQLEQGYVLFLRTPDYEKQINIAFYEHRNSDEICAVMNKKFTLNAPLASDIYEGMKNKHDVSCKVSMGKAIKMAEWIVLQLVEFWTLNVSQELTTDS